MKKMIVLFMCLALMSLACLQTAMPAGAVQMGTATGDPAPTQSAEIVCARVIAVKALNVRFGASEQEDVMTWLRSGEVVQVLDQSDRDWWKIERDGVIGFARSVYLEEVECES